MNRMDVVFKDLWNTASTRLFMELGQYWDDMEWDDRLEFVQRGRELSKPARQERFNKKGQEEKEERIGWSKK